MNRRSTTGVRRRCFTLLEVVMSSIVVALMLVGAMNAATAARALTTTTNERAAAWRLAEDLASEVATAPIDPMHANFVLDLTEFTANLLRTVASIDADSPRADFPTIDYYHKWSASPPEDVQGAALPGFDATWSRSVEIAMIDEVGSDTLVGADIVGRRVTVTVRRRGETLAEITVLRTLSGDTLWQR